MNRVSLIRLAMAGALVFSLAARGLCESDVLPPFFSVEDAEWIKPSEREWLETQTKLRMAFNTDWPPAAYLDAHGEPAGPAMAWKKRFELFLGVPIQAALVSTAELMDPLSAHRFHLIAALEKTPETEKKYQFLPPLFKTPLAVVVRVRDREQFGGLQSLRFLRLVADASHPSFEGRWRDFFPELQPRPMPSLKACLQAMRAGEADAIIGYEAVLEPEIQRIRQVVTIGGYLPYAATIGMAVPHEDPLLASLLTRITEMTTDFEKERMVQTPGFYPARSIDFFYIALWTTLLILAIVLYALASFLRAAALSRRVRLEEERQMQLRLARDEAERVSRSKTIFLANMSHEIRTPMNAILGFCQLLDRDTTLPPAAREHIRTIMRSGEHLLALINNILEISKIEAGRLEIVRHVFPLREWLRDLKSLFQVQAQAKGLEWEVEVSPEVPERIVTDDGKIRQIFINLVGNALKFTQKGAVRVRVGKALGKDGQPVIRVEVEDTGPGIPPEDQKHLFQPFAHGNGTAHKHGGTGLGLSISYRYLEILKGRLDLAWTEPGRGTLFRFEFPLEEAGPDAAAELVRQQETADIVRVRMPDGSRPRVMVVDDEPINRQVIVCALRSLEFEVIEAESGAEAIALFDQKRPDAILMDIRMPGMNGLEATHRIRQRPGGGAVPIIALTASAFESDKERILSAGLSGYVRKPFKMTNLLESLRSVLPLQCEFRRRVSPDLSRDLPEICKWPAILRSSLYEAAREADVDRLEELLASVEESPAKAAIRLLLDAYDYRGIMAAVCDPDAIASISPPETSPNQT